MSSSSCEQIVPSPRRRPRAAAAPSCKEDLARAPDHVPALVLEPGVPLPHLVPDPAQRVVGQELDHVPGREELVAERQFIRVAGGLALLAGLIPQLLGREILVDPADRLVLRTRSRPAPRR